MGLVVMGMGSLHGLRGTQGRLTRDGRRDGAIVGAQRCRDPPALHVRGLSRYAEGTRLGELDAGASCAWGAISGLACTWARDFAGLLVVK